VKSKELEKLIVEERWKRNQGIVAWQMRRIVGIKVQVAKNRKEEIGVENFN
jgi:hypothetical protein